MKSKMIGASLGSFVLGLLVGLSLMDSGSQTSTLLQASPSWAESPPTVLGLAPTATPVVPPLPLVEVEGLVLEKGTVILDGLNCKRCLMEGVTLKYGGGHFNLPETRITSFRVEFSGAARNTLILLRLLGALNAGRPTPKVVPIPPAQPLPPIIREVKIKQQTIADLTSFVK